MPDRFVDPYVDPETGVLRNLVGARSYDDLARAEGEFASLRMGELIERGNLRPTGTLEDFRSIHRVLFQARIAQFFRTPCVSLRQLQLCPPV